MAKRWLTFAVVTALFVPTVAMAAPLVVPPTTEQLVEGHTVFAILEAFTNITNTQEQYATAVAVLVRETTSASSSARFPGVLWFNDQYLVNPEANANAADRFRYPCGGAVMVVNQGAPDPRVVLANAGSSEETRDVLTGVDYGEPDYALVNVTTDGSVRSDTVTSSATAGVDYVNSYMIHDPNDHVWRIDKYKQYHRAPPAGAGGEVVYDGFVWVVNIGGGHVFIPDDGESNCAPYEDLVSHYLPQAGAVDDAVGPAWNNAVGSKFLQPDNPPRGYDEPSRNGFCYNGNPAPCSSTGTTQPIRLYNALVYLELQDLDVAGAPVDHSSPTTSPDTNGCQTGTEWACPGGDDNLEGNSHPFHPTPTGRAGGNPSHQERMDCPAAFLDPAGGSNPTNHGGSTTGYCDYTHATRLVDIYFSGSGRPMPPAVPSFTGRGSEGLTTTVASGSGAAFHDYHSAYETTTAP